MLALDISPRSRAALEMASVLAAELDAELSGLFVEDIDLLRLSGLPFVRELGLFSRDQHPITAHEVERAMQREAAEAQRQLAEAARRLQLRWSFNVARGRIASELFSRAAGFDLVVLGKCARLGLRLVGDSLAEMEYRPEAANPVVVAYDGSAGSEHLAAARRALELSGRMARDGGVELQVLVTTAMAENCARDIAAAKSWLAQAGLATASCRCVISDPIGALAKAVREARAGVLVLGGEGHYRSGEGFATLLNEIDCPVILVT